MSFQVTKSDVELVNRALALLAEEPIPALEGTSGNAARTARRFYKPVVAGLLERWHWNLAAKRQLLAAITNTRGGEWLYAYALPADCAYVKGVALGWSGAQPYYGALRGLLERRRYEKADNTLYSQTAAAVLEYTSYDVTEQDFDEEFSNVIVLSLAAAFAMPITKKPSLADKYREAANTALDTALARDRNINSPTYGNGLTETEIVRGASFGYGFGDPYFTGNVPFDPAGIS